MNNKIAGRSVGFLVLVVSMQNTAAQAENCVGNLAERCQCHYDQALDKLMQANANANPSKMKVIKSKIVAGKDALYRCIVKGNDDNMADIDSVMNGIEENNRK